MGKKPCGSKKTKKVKKVKDKSLGKDIIVNR